MQDSLKELQRYMLNTDTLTKYELNAKRDLKLAVVRAKYAERERKRATLGSQYNSEEEDSIEDVSEDPEYHDLKR